MRAELERPTPLESDRPRANEAVADLGVLGRFGMASWEGAQSRQSIGINSDGLRCTLQLQQCGQQPQPRRLHHRDRERRRRGHSRRLHHHPRPRLGT